MASLSFDLRIASRPIRFVFVRKEQRSSPDNGGTSHLFIGGAADDRAQRAEASWVRMFVDGREIETRVFNEGIGLPDAKSDKPVPTVFRIGWDTAAKSKRYGGRLDEVAVWTRALTDAEIANLFESRALPYAVGRQREQKATPMETDWLRKVASQEDQQRFC